MLASVGFGGSCFQKDILNLVYLCEHFGLSEVAAYWEQVVKMNDHQKRRFAERIVKTMFNTVSDKQIAIWGYAFKKDTNDTRESPATYVCHDLLQERARLTIYDPKVPAAQIRDELEAAFRTRRGILNPADKELIENNVRVVQSCEEAAHGAHAIAVLTEWDEFRSADFAKIQDSMHQPAFVFDGRNVLDRQALEAAGFEYHGIGKS